VVGVVGSVRWLIISLQGLGDTIMLTPVVRSIAEEPGAQISLVVSDNGSWQYVESLGLQGVRSIYAWHERDGVLRNILRLGWQLLQTEFDVAVATYPAGRREALLLRMVRAREKRIFRYYKGFFKSWQFLHPTARVADRWWHNVEANALLAGVGVVPPVAKVRAGMGGRPVIGVHIGGKGASKRWDTRKFAELMRRLHAEFGCHFVVFAGAEELELVRTLRMALAVPIEEVLGAPLLDVKHALDKLTLLIGNDSSIAHLASVVGVPTVVIWSFAEFWRVSPYGYGNILIKKDYSCMPCYDFTKSYPLDCPFHLRCIRDITVDDVFDIAKRCIEVIMAGRLIDARDFAGIDRLRSCQQLGSGCVVLCIRS
jgi:ADP-heptose:LPS heptosyltransferase